MKSAISYKCEDGRIGCNECKKMGISRTFSAYSGISRHYRTTHSVSDDTTNYSIKETTKTQSDETLRKTNEKLRQDSIKLQDVIQKLNQKVEWLESQNDKIIKNITTKQKTTVKPTVPKQLKTKIWQNAYGTENVTGKCYCCGVVDLHITFFEAGHLISHANGGEMSEKNLRPVCSGCNKGMGTKNMRDYAMVVYPLTSPLLKEKTTIEIKIRQK